MCTLAAAACVSGQPASPGAAGTAAWSKLAPGLRAWSSQSDTKEIAVLIRTTGTPGPRERRQLQEAGVRALAISGDVVSGRIAGRSLLRLAEVPFVMRIEKAQPVEPEQEVPR